MNANKKDRSYTIPDSINEIDRWFFDDCTDFNSIIIPKSVSKIDISAFRNCTDLTSIKVHEDNRVYSSENGVLFNKDKTELIIMPQGWLGVYNIPNSVVDIQSFAFKGCVGLTSVTIPNSMNEIGSFAFDDCTGLISITIPNSVTIIGQYAFRVVLV